MRTLIVSTLALFAALATAAPADASRGCGKYCCGMSNGLTLNGIKLQGRSTAAVAAVDAGALRVRAIRLPGGRSSG